MAEEAGRLVLHNLVLHNCVGKEGGYLKSRIETRVFR